MVLRDILCVLKYKALKKNEKKKKEKKKREEKHTKQIGKLQGDGR